MGQSLKGSHCFQMGSNFFEEGLREVLIPMAWGLAGRCLSKEIAWGYKLLLGV